MRVWDTYTLSWTEVPEATVNSFPARFKPEFPLKMEPKVTIPTSNPPSSPFNMSNHVSAAAYTGALVELIDAGLNYGLKIDIPSGLAIALAVVLQPIAAWILKKIGE